MIVLAKVVKSQSTNLGKLLPCYPNLTLLVLIIGKCRKVIHFPEKFFIAIYGLYCCCLAVCRCTQICSYFIGLFILCTGILLCKSENYFQLSEYCLGYFTYLQLYFYCLVKSVLIWVLYKSNARHSQKFASELYQMRVTFISYLPKL